MAAKTNTKDTIMQAALDLFSQTGYAGTSIRHIANQVGIRESAIYNHFKSKEEILKEIIGIFDANAAGANIINEELIEQIDKPYAFMRDFSKKLFEQWNSERERKYFRLLIMEQFRKIEGVDLSVTKYYDETRRIWQMIFEQMRKHKFIKKCDPKIMAEEFVAPLYFIRMEHMVDKKSNGFKKAVDHMKKHVDFFWDAIKQK